MDRESRRPPSASEAARARADADGVGPLVTPLIASATDLEAIAEDDNADVLALNGWRKDVFGDDALLLKSGKIALSADRARIKVIRI